MDTRHAGHRLHRARQRQRVLAVPPHADVERAQAAQREPRFEWAERCAGPGRASPGHTHRRGIAGDHPRDEIRMAAEVFRRAVHHQARAQVERATQERRREGVVDQKRNAALSSHRRDGFDVRHPAQRVGDGLRDDETRRLHGPVDRVELGQVDEADPVSGRLEVLAQHGRGSPVQLSRRDDRRRLRRQGKDRSVQGGHAGGCCDPCVRSFELGDGPLQHLAVLVRVAAVVMTWSLATHDGVVVLEVGEDVDRRGAQVGREGTAGFQVSAGVDCARGRL